MPLYYRGSNIRISFSLTIPPPSMELRATSFSWKFHHENWDTPWQSQSGDFPAHETDLEHMNRQRLFKIQSWFRLASCEATQLLRQEFNRWPWGYTIYRTVYTPESDIQWKAAADAIRANIFATLDWALQHGRRQDKQAHRLLRDGYRSLVFKDKANLEGASIDQVREQFKAFVTSDPGAFGTRFRWCLVIDEEALQSFIRHPQPAEFCELLQPDGIEKNGAWVTVVDPVFELDTKPRRGKRSYRGYMRCHLNRLESLAWAGCVNHMSEIIHQGPDGIPWFEDNI
jgi:hypothetical protein